MFKELQSVVHQWFVGIHVDVCGDSCGRLWGFMWTFVGIHVDVCGETLNRGHFLHEKPVA